MSDALLGTWPLSLSIALLVACAAAIGFVGPRLASLAETLAIRTGMGQALSGAVFLGASTSLPGLITSVAAAAEGHAELSISNALGGIAAQTVFLSIADMFYRPANLEHAAASPTNILQCGLLLGLLALLLMAMVSPEFDILGIHPVTLLLFPAYIFGLRLAYRTHDEPMWRPQQTLETKKEDEEDDRDARPTGKLWLSFSVAAFIVGGAGWVLARSGISISQQTGLAETFVGGLLTAVSTSLPELVTAIAAVRQGAVALAVGNIIGGNAFDTLFAAVSDCFYREGSLYHAVGAREMFLISLSVLLNSILLMGLVQRERRGIGNIGFESFLIIVFYLGGFAVMFLF